MLQLKREELLPLDKEMLAEIILKQQEQILVLTKREEKKGKRKSGGQKHHEPHRLEQVEKPDHTIEIAVTACDCSADIDLSQAPVLGYERRQVFEIPKPKIEVTEYRAEIKCCPSCGKQNKADFALLVYLNQQMLLPAKRTVQLMADIFGQKVSQGTLFHAVDVCYDKLKDYEDAVKKMLQQAGIMHVDESGVRAAGSLHWLHVACTEMLTFYGVHKNRGKIAMDELNVLGEFIGRLIHDHWKPYFKYDCLHGLCNAHHLRELLFLFEEEKQTWAGEMMRVLLDMNDFTRKRKDTGITKLTGAEKAPWLTRYRAIIEQGWKDNPLIKPKNPKPDEVLAFLHDLNVPFTNNLGEQDIRMIKVRLKVSGCFRTLDGAQKFARIRGYLSTARKNKHDLLGAIIDAFQDKAIIPSK